MVFETKKAATFGVPRPSKGIGNDGLDRKLPAKEERGVPEGHALRSGLFCRPEITARKAQKNQPKICGEDVHHSG
jgi:hypothetical protein